MSDRVTLAIIRPEINPGFFEACWREGQQEMSFSFFRSVRYKEDFKIMFPPCLR